MRMIGPMEIIILLIVIGIPIALIAVALVFLLRRNKPTAAAQQCRICGAPCNPSPGFCSRCGAKLT